MSQMLYDPMHAPGIRASRLHALLSFAHLARGDHLHRLGDFLCVAYALDLGADFFAYRHKSLPGMSLLKILDGRVQLSHNFIVVVATAVNLFQ